jgi:hypothetical protein
MRGPFSPVLVTCLALPCFAIACSGGASTAAAPDAGADDAPATDAAIEAGPDGSADSGDAGVPGTTVDPLSSVAGSAGEHEPFVAVTPQGRVGVSFLSVLSTGIGYSVGYRISNDHGITWGAAALFPLPAGDNVQANASVAAGDDENLYMAWAAEERTQTGRANEHVFVAVSPPGSTTFGAPVEVTDPSVAVGVYDQPRVMVTHAGVVNVGFLQASPDLTTFLLQNARSADGKTWTRNAIAGPGATNSFRNEARFCRLQGAGRTYVVYDETDVAMINGDIAVAVRSSDDDGMTWSAPIAATDADEQYLDATANLGCVTAGDEVWIYYGLTTENLGGSQQGSPTLQPALTRIRVAHSSDRGATIDRRADVMDTAAAPRGMYPVLAVDDTGALDLSYYTGKADNDPKAELRRTRSTDGSTFAPTVPVFGPLTLETSRSSPAWIGDYVGGTVRDGEVYLVFTDNSGPKTHVALYTAPVALP